MDGLQPWGDGFNAEHLDGRAREGAGRRWSAEGRRPASWRREGQNRTRERGRGENRTSRGAGSKPDKRARNAGQIRAKPDGTRWPTPGAADSHQVKAHKGGNPSLTGAVELEDRKGGTRGMLAQGGAPLAEQMRWATPCRRDDKGPSTRAQAHSGACLPGQAGGSGKLSADWVEALMGFPPGWTCLPDGPPVEGSRKPPGSRRAPSPAESLSVELDSAPSATPSSRRRRGRSGG